MLLDLAYHITYHFNCLGAHELHVWNWINGISVAPDNRSLLSMIGSYIMNV